MLVLTRKSNQSIMIGDDITITVTALVGEKVRIGIQAPRDLPVYREEIYNEILAERAITATPEHDRVGDVPVEIAVNTQSGRQPAHV